MRKARFTDEQMVAIIREADREPVSAVAKRTLWPGERIRRGIGSFELRGEAVSIAANPHHLPIGLVDDGVVRRRVDPGQRLSLDDMEIPESPAFAAWRAIAQAVGAGDRAR